LLEARLLQLICGDVIRPSIAWLLTTTSPQNMAAEMARASAGPSAAVSPH
jgi:hypothetical protein